MSIYSECSSSVIQILTEIAQEDQELLSDVYHFEKFLESLEFPEGAEKCHSPRLFEDWFSIWSWFNFAIVQKHAPSDLQCKYYSNMKLINAQIEEFYYTN